MTTIIFFMLSISSYASAEETTVQLVEDAKSGILIERDTGNILYEKNAHERLPPASMTKIMTMLLIMEAIDKGTVTLDEKIRTSEYAASMGGSQIFLSPGEEMTVQEMLKGIAIGSGNDASVAMAERIAGSEEAFVAMMNNKAKQLKLENTVFQNSTGLPANEHFSTSYDMAIIAKELLKYEEITKYTGKYDDYLRENTDKKFWLVNTNRLVKFYEGVDGVKTGYTNEAKYCLTATAKKNDMRVIAVVFGAPTSKSRNAQVSKMLDYAFAHYQTMPKYKRNELVSTAKINKGMKEEVDVVTTEPISLLMKKGESQDNVTEEVILKDKIIAPVKKGDQLGTIILKKDNEVLIKSDLIANEDVKAANLWQLMKRSVEMLTKTE
ncbi:MULTISPECIES: D-alanyl-D-alanine carboxypeptidase family protein [Bacillaceae]|uniref:D-alanyl-D-alanine carboxypeptidase family protein n=1 Tax=Bacillaceae TaxID=186817 RepID=UPI002A17ABF9|nr:D-alanyl-D-alanine carboxypeptidase family protein [Cytobacillus sp. IB215316]MDX8359743.1 D-alanyl-D-alanine carboxypeptidase family protein [Cytobacillus sp. IB215316]